MIDNTLSISAIAILILATNGSALYEWNSDQIIHCSVWSYVSLALSSVLVCSVPFHTKSIVGDMREKLC